MPMRDHEGRSNEQRTPNECRGIVLIPVSHPKTQKRTNALDISVPIISVFFFFWLPRLADVPPRPRYSSCDDHDELTNERKVEGAKSHAKCRRPEVSNFSSMMYIQCHCCAWSLYAGECSVSCAHNSWWWWYRTAQSVLSSGLSV